MGVVSYGGIGGLVVAHVGRRLLFGRSPRQCAMPRHNGNFRYYESTNILAKASALSVNLNLDGAPIASNSHTHPSHSQMANFSSINFVSIFRCSSSTTNPGYVRRVNSLVLVCSLSSHRHSYMPLIFSSRFLDS